ncbi:DNA helicase/exodeoxyribonuclease V, subunit A [Lachnospiraceae bacterium XBD2001]|nr:DNA helicase/exodeoxyribonuclease V, subunit A [Lachnospiraceae bacterium XBD2001]
MEWTDSQKQVIELHNRDLLVSAAAGSGKTAVLVERIISMVTREDHPVDIDRILVVTFTRAAAKEMKERIYEAIRKALEEHPDNAHLIRQSTLIHNAWISTIDSFCSTLVRQHFGEIDLDPEYRMADPGELELLISQTWDEVLEANYEAGEEAFLRLVNSYTVGDRDTQLVEYLRKLYTMSQAYPWPSEWLDGLLEPYRVTSTRELLEAPWMQQVWQDLRNQLMDIQQTAQQLLLDLQHLAGAEGHPYEDAIRSDLQWIGCLLEATDYPSILEIAKGWPKFADLSRKKFPWNDEEEKKSYQNRRKEVKDRLTQLQGTYLTKSLTDVVEEMQDLFGIVSEMVRLVKEFDEAFYSKKRKLGLMDFSDMEHFALDILVDRTTHELRPVAKEMAAFFEEVMVDEYQDSNYLQETILHAVSKESLGSNNYFMVGDVKQSIYRFRQAEPKIFNDKYTAFSKEASTHQRIDLDANFRSRGNIIETVNDVFRYIMQPDMGGVAYDEDATLKLGATFYPPSSADLRTEFLVVQKDDPVFADEHIQADEAEWVKIALRINELIASGMEVYDKKTGGMRPLTYGDVAVLRRGLSGGVGERMMEVFDSYRIPSHLESSTGYFNTLEVEVVLSFLRILDNPRQEVPLVAILRSPIVGCSDEDLSKIRLEYPEGSFAEAVFAYGEEHEEDTRIQKFLALYEKMRALTTDTSIHRIIQILYLETGYDEYVSALPGGAVRKANLEKLVDLAVTYENSSFHGLFHFVNYIEKLKKYQVDFGEADLTGEEDNAVRIMTIHKSKGLEFPVVILSGATKGFNKSDYSGEVLLHANLGVGLYRIDPLRRIKSDTLYRDYLSGQIQVDLLGEELRVLYVALTRAREKLIISGSMSGKDFDDLTQKAIGYGESFEERRKAGCYLKWMMPAILHNPGKYQLEAVEGSHLVLGVVAEEVSSEMTREGLMEQLSQVKEEDIHALQEGFSFTYGYPRHSGYKNKYSVSELKHLAIEGAMADGLLPEHEDGESKVLFGTEEKKKIRPAFLSGEAADAVYVGALRGTAMHRYMECFDFVRPNAAETYEEQLEEMIAAGKVTKEQEALLRDRQLRTFLHSDVAGRMMTAATQGNLYKERAFVMGDTPEHFLDGAESSDSGEMILVQGIIDVFFKEEDGIVLLDYKTDRVDSAEELVLRYRRQMELYGDAIWRTQGMPVKEMYLYSFALGETILVES